MADIIEREEFLFEKWKGIASRLYKMAEGMYQIVEIPAQPDPPGIDLPLVEFYRPGSALVVGAKILTFDEVFASREAMHLLMGWAVEQFFPEDE